MATSSLDRFLIAADNALRTLSGAVTASRSAPGAKPGPSEQAPEAAHVAGLMRVDHAGEVCAQTLYAGQALMARDPRVRSALERAGAEEPTTSPGAPSACASSTRDRACSRPSGTRAPLPLESSPAPPGPAGAWASSIETERQVEKHIDDVALKRISRPYEREMLYSAVS